MFDADEAIISHGKHIAYSDTEGGTYTNVDGTVDVNLPERELGGSEITNDDSPDFHKDYIPGMYEPGTTGFTYRYNKTTFEALETIYQLASASGTRLQATKWWLVTIPDGSTAKFRGFLTAHNLPMEGAEDSPVVECEIQVRGKIAYTPAS
jgi:hypothetical protein